MKFFSQKLFASSFLLAMFMVAFEVSPWMSVFCVGVLVFKASSEFWGWRPVSRKVSGILSVILLGQVLFQFRTLIGQEPAFHFLLGLAALKILDYKSSRDHKFLVLLGFVLISVKALFNLDIYWLLPSVLSLLGLWYSLLPASMPQKTDILLKVSLASVPLGLLMFITFPRVQVPWALPRVSPVGQIGFSDQMMPGSISGIAGTNQMAFRAKLENISLLKSEELYWRGAVLLSSHGLTWKSGMQNPEYQSAETSREFNYQVAIEPTAQNYLFVLQGTTKVEMVSDAAVEWTGSVFRSRRPINKATFYRGYYDKGFVEKNTSQNIERFLHHPPLSSKTTQWVTETLKQTHTPQERLERLKKLFSESGFRYTLTPGTYQDNELEEFLFERRLGFCEHFSGAYATLARALGVPSRVVLGYQGGVYNPLGDIWRVSQRDAHAWVEVLIDDSWTQVDPTRWIAPLRFIIGGEAFFALSEVDQQAFSHSIQWKDKNREGAWAWVQDISFVVEDLNYRWNYFLLEFDSGAQKNFIAELLKQPVMLVSLSAVLALGLWFLFRSLARGQRVLPSSRAERLLVDIEKWSRSKGVVRSDGETPLEYLQTLSHRFPEYDFFWREAVTVFDRELYSESKTNQVLFVQLRKKWKRLRH